MSQQMNRCGSCRFFGPPHTREYGDDYEPVEGSRRTFHSCLQVKHVDRLYGIQRVPEPGEAVVIDGSDYFARLLVDDDFGCVNWEKAEAANLDPEGP